MGVNVVSLKMARADFDECNPASVVWVNVGVYFKYKSRETWLIGHDSPFIGFARPGSGGNSDECVEQLLYPEIIKRTSKENGSQVAIEVIFLVKCRVNPFDQFMFLPKVCRLFTKQFVEFGMRQVIELYARLDFLDIGIKKLQCIIVQIVYTLEIVTATNRPAQRPDLYIELFFNLIEQGECIMGGTVHFVDEYNHRSVSHPAYVHQFLRLGLDTLGCIDDDDYAVDRSQCPEGIFLEILVARSIEDVDFVSVIFKTHYRSGNRDTSLSLNLHEVGGGPFLDFIAFYGTGYPDGSPEKEKFFGEGGFTGIGVTHDAKSAPTHQLFLKIHAFIRLRPQN